MAFCSGFPAAVLGPVHAIGNKPDGCRINHVDDALKPARKADILTPHPEGRSPLVQIAQRLPKQFFGHISVSLAVCMGQAIAARRLRLTHSREAARMISERITYVIKTERMRKLCKQHTVHVTPRRKFTAFLINPVLACQFRHKVSRNVFDNLLLDGKLMAGRLHNGTPVLTFLSTSKHAA